MLIQRCCQHYAAPIVAVLLVTASAFAADHVTGVSNFHKVNDNLYRGGQPTAEGFKALAHLGIKTIVDLRGTGDGSGVASHAGAVLLQLLADRFGLTMALSGKC